MISTAPDMSTLISRYPNLYPTGRRDQIPDVPAVKLLAIKDARLERLKLLAALGDLTPAERRDVDAGLVLRGFVVRLARKRGVMLL